MSKDSSKHKTDATIETLRNGSNNRGLVTFIHLVAAVQFCFAVYYDYAHVHMPHHMQRLGGNFGGKFKYLTFLDAVIRFLQLSNYLCSIMLLHC